MNAAGCFVAGTDTGVGKTRIAAGLLAAASRRGRALGMKPVASGCRVTPAGLRNDDAEALMRAANVVAEYDVVNPYAFEPAISPQLAASHAGVTIRLDAIRAHAESLAACADYLVVEGAGGWLTPISDTLTMADVARTVDLPVVLVVGLRLGCVNHALLTETAILDAGLTLRGWVANRIDPGLLYPEEVCASLGRRLRAPLLAECPYGPTSETVLDAALDVLLATRNVAL